MQVTMQSTDVHRCCVVGTEPDNYKMESGIGNDF